MNSTEVFDRNRPLLFSICYRIEQAPEVAGTADLDDSLSMAFLVLLEGSKTIRLVVNPEKLESVPPLEQGEEDAG